MSKNNGKCASLNINEKKNDGTWLHFNLLIVVKLLFSSGEQGDKILTTRATMALCHVQFNNLMGGTLLKGKHLCFKAFSLIAIICSTLKILQNKVSRFPCWKKTGQHVLWDIESDSHSLLTVSCRACISIKYVFDRLPTNFVTLLICPCV